MLSWCRFRSRCIDAVTLQTEPLAEIVGESMALNFYKTLADMYLTLSVLTSAYWITLKNQECQSFKS